MLGDLYRDSDNKYEYKLTLCKPNKTPIVELSETTNITYNAKFKDIDELSFRIPRYVKGLVSHRQEKNPNFDLVKGDFLILCETQNESKYFVIQNPKRGKENSVYKDLTCLSLEIGLNKKSLRLFKGTRQLYTPKIQYSYDGEYWFDYTQPIIAVNTPDSTPLYAKTREHNNIVEISAITNMALGTRIIDGVGFSIVEKSEQTGEVVQVYKEVTISTAGEIGVGILNRFEDEQNTWKIGYIDPLVYRDTFGEHNKYRTFDIAEKSWLDMFRSEIEPAFDCICLFDTVNNLINIYHIDTLSEDRGLFICEENFLKSITETMKFDEIYTRLHVLGNEGATINTVNPTGLDWIDFFKFYKDNGYMSDDLVTALNTYEALLESKKGVFATYLGQLKEQQNILGNKQLDLAQLQSELIIILDNIDLAIQNGTDLTSLNQQKTAKQVQIDSKKAEIDVIDAEIESITNDIANLKDEVDMNYNFTARQLEELDYYIKEKTWQNETLSNPEELYEEVKKAIKVINEPTVEHEIDIVDLFKLVECQYEWDKVKLGTIITLNSEALDIDIQLRIVEINHGDSGLKLTLSNKGKKSEYTRHLSDGIGKMASASTYVQYNKDIWNKTEGNGNFIKDLIQNGLDASKYAVLGGRNQAIRIDEHGALFTDMTNPNEQLKIINNCLAMTIDNWDSADLAITPYGIMARKIIGNLLMSNKLSITNVANNIIIDENGFTLKDNQYKTLISPQGVASTDNLPFLDSVDSSSPLVMDFFIDDNVNVIDKVLLKFSVQDFRAYSKGSASGGGTSTTSSSDGTHRHMMFRNIQESTPLGDIINGYGFQGTTSSSGVIPAEIFIPMTNSPSTNDLYTYESSGNHAHTVTVASHVHGIVPGIYTTPKTVGSMNVYVDGILRSTVLEEKNLVDLTSFVATKGWHQITITSSALNRYAASIYIKSYIGA